MSGAPEEFLILADLSDSSRNINSLFVCQACQLRLLNRASLIQRSLSRSAYSLIARRHPYLRLLGHISLQNYPKNDICLGYIPVIFDTFRKKPF